MDNDPLVFATNIQVLGAKTRSKDFLLWVGELLNFDWLKQVKHKVIIVTTLHFTFCKTTQKS